MYCVRRRRIRKIGRIARTCRGNIFPKEQPEGARERHRRGASSASPWPVPISMFLALPTPHHCPDPRRSRAATLRAVDSDESPVFYGTTHLGGQGTKGRVAAPQQRRVGVVVVGSHNPLRQRGLRGATREIFARQFVSPVIRVRYKFHKPCSECGLVAFAREMDKAQRRSKLGFS